MILAASFVKTPVPYLPRWARRLATPALFRFYPAASRAKALLGGYGTREVRRLLAEAHALAGPEALACRARATLSIDATDALAACPVPVLYLRARKDGVIPASRADEIARALPVAGDRRHRRASPGAGHEPGRGLGGAERFMDRVDARRAAARKACPHTLALFASEGKRLRCADHMPGQPSGASTRRLQLSSMPLPQISAAPGLTAGVAVVAVVAPREPVAVPVAGVAAAVLAGEELRHVGGAIDDLLAHRRDRLAMILHAVAAGADPAPPRRRSAPTTRRSTPAGARRPSARAAASAPSM